MDNLLNRVALLMFFVATVAAAQDRAPRVRNIYLSGDPRLEAPRLNVGARIATVLQFQVAVDLSRTKLLGWEGRFVPLLMGGKTVVLEPLQSVAPEEQFLMLVTLKDGSELPFTVTAQENGLVDQQVNIFEDTGTTEAMRSRLSDAHSRERVLQAQNERYRKEETSVDHALAQLLANGAKGMTHFRKDRKWSLPCDGGMLEVQSLTGQGKVAVVFQVTNLDTMAPWRMREARLVTASSGQPRPFALRMERDEIAPGASGRIAVVADEAAFSVNNGPERLVLELFRDDGMQVAEVLLEQQTGR